MLGQATIEKYKETTKGKKKKKSLNRRDICTKFSYITNTPWNFYVKYSFPTHSIFFFKSPWFPDTFQLY